MDVLPPIYACGVWMTLVVREDSRLHAFFLALSGIGWGLLSPRLVSILRDVADFAAPLYALTAVFFVRQTDDTVVTDKPNLNGTWRMVSATNQSDYLDAIRLGPLARRILLRAATWQVIRIRGSKIRLNTKTRIASINGDYVLGGPPVRTKVNKEIFEDTVYWEDEVLVMRKVNVGRGYDILIRRTLNSDGNMTTTQLVTTFDGSRPPVTMHQLFKRT